MERKNKNEDWKFAAQSILKNKNIIPVKKMFHHGTGNIRIFTAGTKQKYLIKSYPKKNFGIREGINLWNVQDSNICAPRYFGEFNGFLIEEYIEGKLFQDIIDTDEAYGIYEHTIQELVKIHSSGNLLRDRRRLKKMFEIKSLQKRVNTFFYFIEKFGLPSFKKFSDKPKNEWIRALKKISVPRLLRVNSVSGKRYIIGHGDYKPNNIIITRHGLCIIDWLSMAKAQPWYDLAYLLVHIKNTKEKKQFISLYLDEMRGYSKNLNIPISSAMDMFREGMIYQELQRAKSNSYRIQSEKDIHHINEFKSAMDGITSLVL